MRCRHLFAVLTLVVPLSSGVAAGADPARRPVASGAFEALTFRLEARFDSADPAERAQARVFLHQIRGFDAMREMVLSLPQAERPRRLLYLAAGSHLAPLTLCETLPRGTPCELLMTEVDPAVQEPIGALLAELVKLALGRELESGEPLPATGGTRTWRLHLGSHPVTVTLRVEPASPSGSAPRLVRAADLVAADLVISHDWSGDPLVNLEVILDELVAARVGSTRPPPLMIEDLERHPYPVDLSLFSPRARTSLPYGHRVADAGVGRHGAVELGEPLFGGGVLLGFDQPWWREVDPQTLEGVFNFLLFNQFDTERQNVLEGGAKPLVAPALLDWWTGFGRRTIRDQNLGEDPTARTRMLDAVAAVLPRLEPEQRSRLACRLQLYRSLIHARAAGLDLDPLLPAASCCRTLDPKDFPSPDMTRLYEEAVANLAVRDLDRQEERAAADTLLALLDGEKLLALAGGCEGSVPVVGAAEPEAWAEAVRRLGGRLASAGPAGPKG